MKNTNNYSVYLMMLTILVFMNYTVSSQTNTTNIDLSGNVKNKAQKPIKYAYISLMQHDSIVHETISDKIGNFVFDNITKKGKYTLSVACLGYKKYTTNIQLKSEKNQTSVVLLDSINEIEEIKVQGAKNKTEVYADKNVYEISADIKKQSKNSYEILQTIPFLFVEPTERIIKHSSNSNTIVLVNGIKRDNSYVDMIDPQSVVKVELIENPTARYTVQGNFCIINIITKTMTQKGLSININTQQNPKLFFGISFASIRYGNEKFNIYAHGQHFFFNNDEFNIEKNINSYDKKNTFNTLSNGSGTFTMNSYYLNIGLDIFLNKKSYLNINSKAIYSPSENEQTEHIKHLSSINPENYVSKHYSKSPYNQQRIDIYYETKLKNDRKKIQAAVAYNRYGYGQNTDFTKISTTEINNKRIIENQKQSVIFEINYQFPIKSVNAEIGYYAYYQETKLFENEQKIDYTQTKNYLYANSSGTLLKKINFQLGLGIDYINSEISLIKNNFIELLPNASISYNLTKKIALRTSYKRHRYDLPITYLNPYNRANLDSLTVIVGNPKLRPYYTNIIDFKIMYMINSKLNITPFVEHTFSNTHVDMVANLIDNQYIISYDNIGKWNTWKTGFNINMNTKIKKFSFFSFNGSLFYKKRYLDVDNFTYDGIGFSIYSSYKYKKYRLSANFYFSDPSYTKNSKNIGINESSVTLSWDISKNWRVSIKSRWLTGGKMTNYYINKNIYESENITNYKNRNWCLLFGIIYNFMTKKRLKYYQKNIKLNDQGIKM